MNRKINWDRVLLCVAVLGFVVIFIASLKRPLPFVPPEPVGTGEYVVIIVDDDAPTIAEGIIVDGPQLRALRAAGKCIVRSTAWKRYKDKHYDALVTKAGGTPALAVIDKDGKCAHCGKLPMEEAKLQELCRKFVVGLPPPSEGELTAIVPSAAPVSTSPRTDPSTPPYVVVDGQKRYLAAFPAPGRMAALPKYSDTHPVWPESEWRELDRRSIFGAADWIFDQDGHGSCVPNGWANALRKVRWSAGMTDAKLSPGFLYSLINGGRDQGAVISDGISALQNTGTCAFKTVGQDPIYARQMPSAARTEAARYKLGSAYHCTTWEEIGSALLTGRYIPVFGVQVGSNWTRFDKFGVAGHDRGPGNHCLHADGLRKTGDGRWVLDVPNSWAYSWGPFQNGRVLLDKQHLVGGGDQPDACVVRVPADDPQEPNDFPSYKGN